MVANYKPSRSKRLSNLPMWKDLDDADADDSVGWEEWEFQIFCILISGKVSSES